jgi:murein L,D-transpeptidase YafK
VRRALVIVALLAGLASTGRADDESAVCAGERALVHVDGARHRLTVCEAGRAVIVAKVALGRGGLGKRTEGDGKTPVGRYPLGAPRPSEKYGQFIPVGYPTAAERAAGATGGNIGVHGPRRGARWLGAANTWIDWTRGCIAVATDAELAAVVAWVRAHPRAEILIVTR